MSEDILIIGSGFAARQLVKHLRQQDKTVPIRVLAADSCDEYNKPELSHVISLRCAADDLTRQTAAEWAESQNIMLHPCTVVSDIDTLARRVNSSAGDFAYGKLVLATGARPVIPAMPGSELIYTLNSQQEYRQCATGLMNAARVLIIGAGLIGTELAMDLNRAGKQVTIIDRSAGLLAALLPPEISGRLQHRLINSGVQMMFQTEVTGLARQADSVAATFSDGEKKCFDAVVCAIGLRPDSGLAKRAGIEVRHGIVVDRTLATSVPDIYALGDCAEIEGKLMPYLQPATLAAITLAKNLTGQAANLTLPPMLIKVKTPDMPLQLAGDPANPAYNWQMAFSSDGVIAKGYDPDGVMRAFVVSEDHMKVAFSLLKALNTPAAT